MLASRMGAGVTAGSINAGSQLIQNYGDIDKVKPADVGIATVTGMLGVGGGLWWNTAVSTAGGYWQAQMNNKFYPKGQYTDPFINAVTSGVSGSVGFWSGDKATSLLNGSYPKSLVPIIVGNTVGSGVGENISAGFDNIGNNDNKLNAEKNK